MILIGDAHGQTDELFRILKKNKEKESILLGELGFKKEHDLYLNYFKFFNNKNKVLFGNHDYWPYINESYSLGKFKYFETEIGFIFSIAGALSIDQQYRHENTTWFKEEELNYIEMNKCIDLYTSSKPKIVISHECPESISDILFDYKNKFPNITSKLLDCLLDIHRPSIWVFAHHHKSKNEVIDGTRFICLDELETVDINKYISKEKESNA
jgi:predicted phosphodiesterase